MANKSPLTPPTRRSATGSLTDRLFRRVAEGSGVLIIVLITAVGGFLLLRAIPALQRNKENFFTYGGNWVTTDTSAMHFGVAELLQVTVFVSVFALLLAMPVALGVAIYLTEYAPRRLVGPLAYMVELLAAVPSIIYGAWGLYVLAPQLRGSAQWLNDNLSGFFLFATGNASVAGGGTVFTGGIVLAVMILPIMTAICREIFLQTPRLHQEAALALGATRWEMARMAIFPYARSGIVSAAMLGLGRALGETLAVAMVLSVSVGTVTTNLISSTNPSTIAANIALSFGEASGKTVNALIASGLVLFVITFLVNFAARSVVNRRSEFSGAN